MRLCEVQISADDSYSGLTATVSTNGFLYLHGRKVDLEVVRDAINVKLDQTEPDRTPVEES
jgi:hypothetical protein